MDDDRQWFLVIPLRREHLHGPILVGLQVAVQADDENEAARVATNGGYGEIAGVVPMNVYSATTEGASAHE